MAYDFKALHVAVIDDNAYMLRIVKELLEVLGIRLVSTYSEVEEAIQSMREAVPDLVITDWEMRPSGGLDLIRVLRDPDKSPHPFVPIIVMTAHTTKQCVELARDVGATDFIAKPLSMKRLYDRLINMVDHPRPFVECEVYFGPDRRRKERDFEGEDRRQRAKQDDAA